MKRIDRIAPLLLFAAVALLALSLGILRPMYNWDMIPYAAAAKRFEADDIERIHSFTFAKLRDSFSDYDYSLLASPEGEDPDSRYRRAVSSDPEALSQQLPLFEIRPIYTGMIFLLYRTGINIFTATHLISAIAVFAGILLLYPITASALPRHFAYLVPAGAAVAGTIDLAKYSTPDGLAFLAVVLIVFLLMKRRMIPLLLLLPVAIAIRTDLIVLVIPLCFFLLAGRFGNRLQVYGSALFSILIFILLNSLYSNPGWKTTFHAEFINVTPYPLTADTAVSAKDYLDVLLAESGSLMSHRKFLLYLPAAAISLYLLFRNGRRRALSDPVTVAAAVSLIYVTAHFLLFPDGHERFFAAQYIIGGIALLSAIDREFLHLASERAGE